MYIEADKVYELEEIYFELQDLFIFGESDSYRLKRTDPISMFLYRRKLKLELENINKIFGMAEELKIGFDDPVINNIYYRDFSYIIQKDLSVRPKPLPNNK